MIEAATTPTLGSLFTESNEIVQPAVTLGSPETLFFVTKKIFYLLLENSIVDCETSVIIDVVVLKA